VDTGAKEDEASNGRVWAAGFHHVTTCSRLARVLKLAKRLFLKFSIYSGCVKTRMLNRGYGCTTVIGVFRCPLVLSSTD
jgi:hypothetical protein